MATHSFSHKHADACFGVEGSIRNAFTRPGLSFQSFFLQEIPPLHASESLALSVYYLGNGATSSCFLLYQGRHALSFLGFTHTKFPFGTGGIRAYDMFSCWKWTSNRLEAGGKCSNHPGWEAYWNGSGWHGQGGVAVVALHGKASYT